MEKKQDENKRNEFIKNFSLKKIRKDQLIVILLVGLLLLVIAIPTKETGNATEKSSQGNQQDKAQEAVSEETDSMDAYVNALEEKLETILSGVEGVGKVRVMITLKSSKQIVIEKDKPQSQSKVTENDSTGGSRETTENSWDESTVYIQNEDGSTVPFVIQELTPNIEGVVIIAQGGGDAVVVQNVCDAVKALFSIEIHKIKVMKMET